MTPIYLHEYTVTAMKRDSKMGIQAIVITVVTDKKEHDDFKSVFDAINFFDQDLNISHKILIEGYKQDE